MSNLLMLNAPRRRKRRRKRNPKGSIMELAKGFYMAAGGKYPIKGYPDRKQLYNEALDRAGKVYKQRKQENSKSKAKKVKSKYKRKKYRVIPYVDKKADRFKYKDAAGKLSMIEDSVKHLGGSLASAKKTAAYKKAKNAEGKIRAIRKYLREKDIAVPNRRRRRWRRRDYLGRYRRNQLVWTRGQWMTGIGGFAGGAAVNFALMQGENWVLTREGLVNLINKIPNDKAKKVIYEVGIPVGMTWGATALVSWGIGFLADSKEIHRGMQVGALAVGFSNLVGKAIQAYQNWNKSFGQVVAERLVRSQEVSLTQSADISAAIDATSGMNDYMTVPKDRRLARESRMNDYITVPKENVLAKESKLNDYITVPEVQSMSDYITVPNVRRAHQAGHRLPAWRK